MSEIEQSHVTSQPIPIKPVNATFNDEQWEAIHKRGHNILVSASAGSGKTTVLIERIMSEIVSGFANVDQLLVCTFTEAAANEMKERMESRLKKAINDTSDNMLRQHLLTQLRLLPQAHIRTLHSFCLQVIQHYFYLIDIEPSINLIVDDTQKQLLYNETWEELLASIDSKSPKNHAHYLFEPQTSVADVQRLLSQLTDARSDRQLFQLIVQLHQYSSSHTNPVLWLKEAGSHSEHFESLMTTDLYREVIQPEFQQILYAALKQSDAQRDLLKNCGDDTIQKYASVIDSEKHMIESLLDALLSHRLDNVVSLAQQFTFEKWPANTKKSDDYDTVNMMKTHRDLLKSLLERITNWTLFDYDTMAWIESQLTPSIQALSRLTLDFKTLLQLKKLHQHHIDYNDLEHFTLNILAPLNPHTQQREPSEAALYYQQLIKEVLVDEYQDINEIQATILSYLSHETRDDLPGNLFMVGDVKQSIYGFRMAEPSLFLEKYYRYANHEDGELIVLDKNYRSRDDVLQFTNFIFEKIMSEDFGEMTYGIRESLKTGNQSFLDTDDATHFGVEFLIHVKEGEEEQPLFDSDDETPLLELDTIDYALIEKSVEYEAEIVVKDIVAKIQSGYLIYDKSQKILRPMQYRDVVILSSTKDVFLPVKQACQRYDVPLITQNIEHYFQRQEIQLMIALLKLIDNPIQDIPLVAILRSYFVGLSDEELSQIRIHSKQGRFYEACLSYIAQFESHRDTFSDLPVAQQIYNKLHDFFIKLKQWQHLSKTASLVELIWEIYEETHFLDYVVGLSNGVQRQANLHALYERAIQFEAQHFKGVFGFVQYIEQIMLNEHDLAEPILMMENDDAIRIMTVHASKGLEFPVVYLMNTQKGFNMQDTRAAAITSKKFGIGMDYFDSEHALRYPSFIRLAMMIQRNQQLKSEEMRKLYVALTRCEQKLIIVGTIKHHTQWEKWQNDVETTQRYAKELVIDTTLRKQQNSWLAWMALALSNDETYPNSTTTYSASNVILRFFNSDETLEQIEVPQRPHTSVDTFLKQLKARLKETSTLTTSTAQYVASLMRFEYPYGLSTRTSSYQSVSELKRLYEEPANDKLSHFENRTRITDKEMIASQGEQSAETNEIYSIRFTGDTFLPPKFMQDDKIDAAQIGTYTHYFMQQLDLTKFSGRDNIATLIHDECQRLLEEQMMHESQLNVVNLKQVEAFLNSDIGQLFISHGAMLRKETAFSYKLPAQWLFESQMGELQVQSLFDDQLLVHGVIDAYIELENGCILLDYKTDRYHATGRLTKSGQIAVIEEKYRFQMSLYAQALQCATTKPVTAIYLVLLDFNEVIEVKTRYSFE